LAALARSHEPVLAWLRPRSVYVAFAALVLFDVLFTPGFRNPLALRSLLFVAAPVVLIALGQSLAIGTRGIDLSVGSVMGLASAAIGLTLGAGQGWAIQGWAILAGIATGFLAGCVNGALVAVLGINPLISSLALLVAARGLAQALLNGSRLDLPSDGPFAGLGRAAVGGVPLVAVGAAAVAVLIAGLVRETIFGRYAVFVGASRTAAFLAGIPVRRTLLLVYALSGALAGAAGVLASARLGAADPNYIGVGLELDAIAAVVIGGKPLSGGRISILGSVFGVLLLSVLDASFIMNDVNATYGQMLKAAFIVAALYLQRSGG
jgi:ribose/xylose/arabinose/galactoside ABC-type transport system permease subunit